MLGSSFVFGAFTTVGLESHTVSSQWKCLEEIDLIIYFISEKLLLRAASNLYRLKKNHKSSLLCLSIFVGFFFFFQLPEQKCNVMYNRNMLLSPYNFTHTHMQFSVYNHPPHLFALNLIISSFIAHFTWLHDVFKVVGAVAFQGKRGCLEMPLKERQAGYTGNATQ